jgi:hypothetical protein
MRRILLTCTALLALGAPAVAAAKVGDSADGTIVVRNADNGDGIGDNARAVVTVAITGFVIGRVSGQGRVEIYDLDSTDTSTPEVTGADSHEDVTWKAHGAGIAGTSWTGTGFTFRAVDGTYRVVVYGSGIYLFAAGHGRVWLTGQSTATGSPTDDGQYSLNGAGWISLPVSTPTPIAVGAVVAG